MKTFSDIFKSKHISLKLNMRTFTAFIISVMLYKSELWTVTKQMEEKINAFQRRQLRIIHAEHGLKLSQMNNYTPSQK